MPESPPTPRKPRRRRFAVGLRALMALIVVVAAGLGWKVNRVRDQKRAVARIEAAGGFAIYDFSFDGTYPYKNVEGPAAPAWLRRTLGDEFFQEVTAVKFYNDKATDADLVAVAACDHLLAFELHDNTKVTDVGLARLRGLKHLRIVELLGSKIGDAGLAHLAALPDLRRLWLRDRDTPIEEIHEESKRRFLADPSTFPSYHSVAGDLRRRKGDAITGKGLAHLEAATRLERLELSCPALRGEDFAHLAKLTGLRQLFVNGTSVAGPGLAHLAKLTGLVELSFAATDIDDASLAHLARLTGLVELDLSLNSLFTDAGLAHLAGLKALRKLDLEGTPASDQAITGLVEAIPGLVVSRGQGPFLVPPPPRPPEMFQLP